MKCVSSFEEAHAIYVEHYTGRLTRAKLLQANQGAEQRLIDKFNGANLNETLRVRLHEEHGLDVFHWDGDSWIVVPPLSPGQGFLSLVTA